MKRNGQLLWKIINFVSSKYSLNSKLQGGSIWPDWGGAELPELTISQLNVFLTPFPMFISFRNIRFFLLLTFLVSLSLSCSRPYSNRYYENTKGLKGDALKQKLYESIKSHNKLSYKEVVNAIKIVHEDPRNDDNIICFYTGWSYPKADFGNDPENWNREHIWSKSHGGFTNGSSEGTDLHHVFPTDASVNSAKNNRDFDYSDKEYIDKSGATNCYYSTYTWEPRDEVKGDVARVLFYMATRYEGENGELDLELVSHTFSAPNKEPYYGNLSTLLRWHTADPVDKTEIKRNNAIHKLQGNRNPFIDHPEFVFLIW